MSSGATVVLIASVLVGSSGVATLDRGWRDGVQAGDRAVVFYDLAVGDASRRITVGEVLVTRVSERSAELGELATARDGYSAELRFPVARTTLAAQLEMARSLSTSPARLAAWIDEIVGDALPADPELRDRTLAALADGTAADPPADPAAAVPPTEPSGTVAPAPHGVLIQGGVYSVGLDLEDAEYYNQTPRFNARLATFRVDQSLVTAEDLRRIQPDFESSAGEDPAVGVSFVVASELCSRRGGRLPTEIEWEVAIQDPRVAGRYPAYEWTSSPYRPYPGNSISEAEYAMDLVVLRGSPDPERFDPHERSYAAPSATGLVTGFRCAYDVASSDP